MGNKHRAKVRRRLRKANTRNIISKLLHNTRNKKYVTKEMRRTSVKRNQNNYESTRTSVTLKLGSINVNGLGLEHDQAVKNLLSKRSLDVRKHIDSYYI